MRSQKFSSICIALFVFAGAGVTLSKTPGQASAMAKTGHEFIT